MSFIEKLKHYTSKWYFWAILIGSVVLAFLALLLSKTPGKLVTPAQVKNLESAVDDIRKDMVKADNEATVKIIKAQTKDEVIHAQVDKINAIDDEYERAKQLVALKNTIK